MLLLIPAVKLNPAEAEAKNLPGTGDAFQGRDALAAAGISAGAMKPYHPRRAGQDRPELRALVVQRRATGGHRRRLGAALREQTGDAGQSSIDAFLDGRLVREARMRNVISNLQHDVLPVLQQQIGGP